MKIKKYFAAANGFSGFRSYFNYVFEPHAFSRIYVIKGGPGTGKSTIMKTVLKHFASADFDCEAIYCSSDPNSLDGVIISNGTKKIAILDGTAPHETDAKIPGSVDEIVNLGEFWNEGGLKNQRAEIEALNARKSYHYKNAYQYLKFAGNFENHLRELISSAYTGSDWEIISALLPKKDIHTNKKCYRLISAFARFGHQSFEKELFASENNLYVTGNMGSEYTFMSHLKSALEIRKTEFILYPSPLSEDKIEAIYIPEIKTFISTIFNFSNNIDTGKYLDIKKLEYNKEMMDLCSKETNNYLSLAQKEFAKASEKHFELEKLYSPSMDFNKINALTENLIARIQENI